MDKFKHIVVANGSLAARKRFAEELEKIGYKIEEDNLYLHGYSTDKYCITVNYKNSYKEASSGVLHGWSNGGTYWRRQGVEYQFEIDDESQFQTALAIAAIRDDNKPYIGEYVVAGGNRSPSFGSVIGTRGSLHKIDVVNTNGIYFSTVGYRGTSGSASDLSYDRKATPEEIIQHFKTNKTTNMGQKKILGYDLKKSEYHDTAVKIIGATDSLNRRTEYYHLPDVCVLENIEALKKAGVLDLWFTPVYEETKIKLGGYEAVKENINGTDVVAFGCQKFDIAELYAYKKLLQGYNENKAEITVAGTKITIEILDRLIALL